jgi:hypothetical protein
MAGNGTCRNDNQGAKTTMVVVGVRIVELERIDDSVEAMDVTILESGECSVVSRDK